MFLMLKPHKLLYAANIFVSAVGLNITTNFIQLARVAITVKVATKNVRAGSEIKMTICRVDLK